MGSKIEFNIDQRKVDGVLENVRKAASRKKSGGNVGLLRGEDILAKFVLLRFDQIDELAFLLSEEMRGQSTLTVSWEGLAKALKNIRDQQLSKVDTFLDYLHNIDYARADYQRKPVYSVKDFTGPGLPQDVVRNSQGVWLRCESGQLCDSLPGYRVKRTDQPGEVQLLPTKSPR